MTEDVARVTAVVAHAGFFLPIGWILLPLGLMLYAAGQPGEWADYVVHHAKQALVYHLAVVVGGIILVLIPILGWMALIIYVPLVYILPIFACIAAYRGDRFRYPLVGHLFP